jgi:SNF2 family DNA or RNA helicase
LLISYAKLQRYKDVIRAHEFKAIVLDEAQLIKNPSAKTSQAIFSLQSQYRIALSGTPIENHLRDLWSIFRFLMPGLLGGQKMFERFMSGSMGTARLRQQLHPFILRRLKQDVLKELPEKVEVVLPCPLTEAQKSLYKRIVEGVHESFGSDFPKADQALHFLTVLLRLRQITCDPALVDPSKDGLEYSGKLMILMQRVAELIENGEKVVIFSQFTSLLERLKKILHQHFPATPVYEITGATSSKSRGVVVQDFQNDRRSAIFLGSLKAAGTGITLHSASYVFMLDPWWNPALEAQAVDRLHRLGQKNTVFVYRLVAPGTVEAKVQALQQSKKELFREVFSDLPLLDQLKSHFENLNALIDFNDEPNE